MLRLFQPERRAQLNRLYRKVVNLIQSADLADGSVIEVKIGNLEVSTDKIKDAAVTQLKIDTDSIDITRLADAVRKQIPRHTLTPVVTLPTAVVTIQTIDANADPLQEEFFYRVWLSDTDKGPVSATPPNVSMGVGASGAIQNTYTANLDMDIVSDTDGKIIVNIDNTAGAAHTWYLCASFDGRIRASTALNL